MERIYLNLQISIALLRNTLYIVNLVLVQALWKTIAVLGSGQFCPLLARPDLPITPLDTLKVPAGVETPRHSQLT